MKAIKSISLALIISLSGCFKIFNKDEYEFTYETIVTESPVNLVNINSYFDDYNSNLPYPGFFHGIYFSTNRNSFGKNFDIIYKGLNITYHRKDDILNISYFHDANIKNNYTSKVLKTINTDFDEYGPFHFFGAKDYEYFFYANNESGNFDIKYVSSKKSDFGTYNGQEIINAPESFTSINSAHDDYYPSIFNGNKSLVFSSNREKEIFNIYETAFMEDEINPTYKIDLEHEIKKNAVLSSDQNDKCPFVLGNIMVFASDREGGYGGFDLYFSQYLNGKWSQPQNMGEKINSAYDEYRPVIIEFGELEDTMLIFSSNKPGGKGGYDLYAARTKVLPK
ncbi:PD40 domain-containing protein [Anditalea andensis]|uniref:WD40 repeat protein n=1 Tax=Anditalea andensis TaxID=1048983 RepID=A0A074KVQ1_9BACT|nr:PD40 domain-containing protein [Anditalea andensis]KEO71648.1 hypothetical protein EL17_23610 [Anditalea andensis]